MQKQTFILSFLFAFLFSLSAHAQQRGASDLKFNLLFGTNQLLLNGFNIEGNLMYKRWIFDYSHGVSLNLNNSILDEVNQAQNLDVHIPWTTGLGIGYFLNDWLNLRLEPKWHKFELYQMESEQNADNLIGSYTTFTLGLGAYANLRPFKKQDNFLRGIMIVPSVRWWPRITSSLENDQLTYFNESLGEVSQHEALQVGVSNSPLILNISVGYSFGWKE